MAWICQPVPRIWVCYGESRAEFHVISMLLEWLDFVYTIVLNCLQYPFIPKMMNEHVFLFVWLFLNKHYSGCMHARLFRHFKLYLSTNTELFTEDFSTVVVEKDGTHQNYEVHRENFFTGHVIGQLWSMNNWNDSVIRFCVCASVLNLT